MDSKEFMKFRMALLPASGFQSAQFRKIELLSTATMNLVELEKRKNFNSASTVEQCFQNIYWKKGAIDAKTGNKTLTLLQFEEKYDKELLALAESKKGRTLMDVFHRIDQLDDKFTAIKKALRTYDLNINVHWPLAHYKSAVRYLHGKDGYAEATGGTNWQKYLPPRFQKRIFFPELWNQEEQNNWGRAWIEEQIS